MLTYIINGFASALVPQNLMVMIVGLLVGIVGGMLPGITTVTAVALFVPFTFSMPPEMALIGLGGVFCGAMYGGANSAILINTPGTPGSIATTLDGYPLVRQGRAEEACYLALLASVIGGIFGVLALMLFFEPLSDMALGFGSEAFFWMGLFGLSTLAAMFPGNIAKGLLGGAIGLAVGTVGLDPVMGLPRFTFDIFELVQGLDMVPLMIGLFSISQMFVLLESKEKYIVSMTRQANAFKKAMQGILGHFKLLGISSTIGTFIGALPGAGGSVAALVSYNEVKRWDKNPERFGKGAIEGIIAPESSNNASVGGALVPLLALGIPGSAAAAVLAGGLMAQGLTPGPQLMEKNPDIAYAFIVSMIIANIGMLIIGYFLVRICTKILDVPKSLIIPAVISISFLGSYALRNSMFDVLLMIVSGALAYLLLKASIMPAGIALGIVLGRIIEENLIVTYYRSQSMDSIADLLVFSPLALIFIIACIIAILVPIILEIRSRRKSGRPAENHAFSLDCLARYDFWVVALISACGIFFSGKAMAINGVSGYFPQAVYISIVCLGFFILIMRLFDARNTKPAFPAISCLINIGVYLVIMAIMYMLAEILGFYVSIFLGVLTMTAYGVFFFYGQKRDVRGMFIVLAYSLIIVAMEYGCFRLLMGVQTPEGILF